MESESAGTPTLSFEQLTSTNPCDGCPAPCCRMLLTPTGVPSTFIELDFVRYALLFPGTEYLVTAGGDWWQVRWQQCSAFEAEGARCRLHGTPEKPRTCTEFSAHNCWYKRTFASAAAEDSYRLDRARFEAWVAEIRFDELGAIVSAPSFERSLELLQGRPIEPTYRTEPRLIKSIPLAPGRQRAAREAGGGTAA